MTHKVGYSIVQVVVRVQPNPRHSDPGVEP